LPRSRIPTWADFQQGGGIPGPDTAGRKFLPDDVTPTVHHVPGECEDAGDVSVDAFHCLSVTTLIANVFPLFRLKILALLQ